jgi:hypothetical protein
MPKRITGVSARTLSKRQGRPDDSLSSGLKYAMKNHWLKVSEGFDFDQADIVKQKSLRHLFLIFPIAHHDRDDFAAGARATVEAAETEPRCTKTHHGAIIFIDFRHRFFSTDDVEYHAGHNAVFVELRHYLGACEIRVAAATN